MVQAQLISDLTKSEMSRVTLRRTKSNVYLSRLIEENNKIEKKTPKSKKGEKRKHRKGGTNNKQTVKCRIGAIYVSN